MIAEIRDIQSKIRETRKEMKRKGIKRTSCFNGGGNRLSINTVTLALQPRYPCSASETVLCRLYLV